jgi:hypothetical protein
MKKLAYLFLLVLLIITGLSSCSDSDDDERVYDLTFEKNDYAVMENYSQNILIRSGNGDYTITSGNSEIIKASYLPATTAGFGSLSVTGLKKGTTTLTIKDNVSGQEVKLNMTVINRYMVLSIDDLSISVKPVEDDNAAKAIKKDITDNALLKPDYYFALIKNSAKTLYIFESEDDLFNGDYIYKGSYEFGKDTNIPYIKLNYKLGSTDKSMQYTLNNTRGISAISSFFELNWETSKSTEPTVFWLELIKDHTQDYEEDYSEVTEVIATTYSLIMPLSSYYIPAELVK